MSKHTPGPWRFEDEMIVSCNGEIIADPYCEPTKHTAPDEMESNARLIAAAPDHALWGAAVCNGAQWQPFSSNDGRGEICVNGLRYATKLDEFGCPIISAVVRAAIAKATGEA